MHGADDNNTTDAFRNSFKYFKRKIPAPDYSQVINFNEELKFNINGIRPFKPCCDSSEVENIEELGLIQLADWKIFTLDLYPGFFFIRNPFTRNGTEHWIKKSFECFCLPPNPTNIKENIDIKNCSDDTILQKLRWSTLGYHHNWDTKEYDENYKGEFPLDLYHLSKVIAENIGFQNFRAEAAIVNYYALDSSIGGHTDHSEKNHNAPLISISFGQTAIFLLGGSNKTIAPTPIFIENGDVVIMSGSTRLNYHAVPRIIHNEEFSIKGRWSSIMSKMRLNINIRQALKEKWEES